MPTPLISPESLERYRNDFVFHNAVNSLLQVLDRGLLSRESLDAALEMATFIYLDPNRQQDVTT